MRGDAEPIAINLLVLPYAGGSVAHMKPLIKALPANFRSFVVELPGRGRRWREEPLFRVDDAVGDLIAHIPFDEPFFVFGHSLGAYLGLALLSALELRGDERGIALFAAGNSAPQRRAAFLDRPIQEIDDDAILEIAGRFESLPPMLAADAELRAWGVRSLRADFGLSDAFLRGWSGERINGHIVTLAGSAEPLSQDDLEQWNFSTGSTFASRRVRGGHFFPIENPSETALAVEEHCRRLLAFTR